MVNPLLILPLLNASTLTTTRNGCYEQKPPGQSQRTSTTFIVCSHAINHMTTGRALDAATVFGRTVKVGHRVPDFFVHKGFYGTCVISIDMKDDQEDTLTWREIIISASNLRDYCVAIPPHLGGEENVGRRQLLDVKMYGINNDGSSDSAVG